MGKDKQKQNSKSKTLKNNKNAALVVNDNSNLSITEFPIAGIGASAGGLDALKELFNNLPHNTGIAYICIQHLDPKHESILTELLGKETKMPVHEVRDGMLVEPDNVYVIPPAKNIELVNKILKLTPREETLGEHMVIDRFFRSLAEQKKSKAIGIIFSGLGSDGTLGIRAIKAEGGLTFAQTLKSAKYDYMPRSAISSGDVDIVDSPAGIAKELKRIGQHPYIVIHKTEETEELFPTKESDLNKIFILLRTITNVDFSQYKPSTANRRIERRMVVNRTDNLQDYLKLLKTNRKEVDALYNDLLINVTNFLRDPQTFEALKQFVFPHLISKLEKGSSLRIWVPGCSTGEEVYSVVISLIEFLGESSSNYPLQFFATDISETAIEKARIGIYTENIKQDVSSSRLKRFFREFNGGYQINKSIRDLCIFARHDVTKDPPFSRIDLISCRNLLIYLNQPVQKKVIPTFHYALKPNGILLLGSSESIGGFADLFNLVDKKYKFYERKQASHKPYFDLTLTPFEFEKSEINKPLPADVFNVQKEADKILMDKYIPPGVLVDDNLNIIQFRGNTGRFLEPASGAATFNLYKMAREGLMLELRNAIQTAKRTGKSVYRKDIEIKTNEQYLVIDIEVIPVKNIPSGKYLNYLVLFNEKAEKPVEVKKSKYAKAKKPQVEISRQKILKMEEELIATKEYLQSIIEEKDSANEELRSALEELQSSNEELQSTNEEMETAKEELQSANEELTTVNEELENRNEETSRINNDLMNLLASVNIAILMLGNDLKIRRFTPTAAKILNLIPSDIGRSFNDINPNIILPNLDSLITDAIDKLEIKEFEVQDLEGAWYSMRLRPYKTIDNKVDGAVLSLVDIDLIKKSEMKINEAKKYAEAILDSVKEPVLVLTDGFKVTTANKAFFSMFKINNEKILNAPISKIGNGWDSEKFKEFLYTILDKDDKFDNYHFEAEFPEIGLQHITLSAKRIYLPQNNKKYVLITF